MPYSGIPQGSEQEAKMERCVADLMWQGKTKEQAIAICHASIAGEADVAVIRAGLELTEAAEADLMGLTAEQKQGRILKFTDAVLAHATINKNDDGLTRDGLAEIAASLAGMPLNIGHDGQRIMGVFTAGQVRDWLRPDGVVVEGGELVGSGLIFALNFPKETKEIQAGERKLSIEATAKRAVFHVDALTGKRTRYLFGLTALGAATTKQPADTGAVFDTTNGLLMISEVKETVELAADRRNTDMYYMVRDAFKRHYKDAHRVVEVEDRHLIFEREGKYYRTDYALDSTGNVTFGDRHTELMMQWVATGGSIHSEEGSMSEKELQEQVAALQAQLDAVKVELAAAQGQASAAGAQITALTAEVDTLRRQAEEAAKEFKASLIKGVQRAVEMAPVLDELTDAVIEELTQMSDSSYELLLKASEGRKQELPKGSVSIDDKARANGQGSKYDYKTIFAFEEA